MGGQLLTLNPTVNGIDRHAKVTGDLADGIPAGLGGFPAGFDPCHSAIVTESREQIHRNNGCVNPIDGDFVVELQGELIWGLLSSEA